MMLSVFGHTEEEVLDKYAWSRDNLRYLRYMMKVYGLLDVQLQKGTRTVITGLRGGVDLWLANYALDLRRSMPDRGIALHAVVAGGEELTLANRVLLEQCDSVEFVDGGEEQAQRMIDASGAVLAVYFDPMAEHAYRYAVTQRVRLISHSPQELVRQIRGMRGGRRR